MTATGNIGQTTVAVRLPQRSAIFDVTATGEFVGVRKLSENHSAPELEIDRHRVAPRIERPRP